VIQAPEVFTTERLVMRLLALDAPDIHEYDSEPMSRLGAYGISHMRRTGVPTLIF
jgi:hypothetical protein